MAEKAGVALAQLFLGGWRSRGCYVGDVLCGDGDEDLVWLVADVKGAWVGEFIDDGPDSEWWRR